MKRLENTNQQQLQVNIVVNGDVGCGSPAFNRNEFRQSWVERVMDPAGNFPARPSTRLRDTRRLARDGKDLKRYNDSKAHSDRVCWPPTSSPVRQENATISTYRVWGAGGARKGGRGHAQEGWHRHRTRREREREGGGGVRVSRTAGINYSVRAEE
ncbi:unnamed protein product [Phytomonas sp. EM1]|nr:unnamed protein product [Phytomonas sp. EM1]|eukprot:CCW63582.1 unnamed protein product [Phytomonas sp. isolate EM1]